MAARSSLRVSALSLNSSGAESRAYAGLTAVAGIRVVSCPPLLDVACPFCATTDLAFMMGKVSFSATISGDDLFDGISQPLVTVICVKSHFFFVRETDLPGTKLTVAA